MLQRVQTLFILGAIICLGLVFVFPIFGISSGEETVEMSTLLELNSDMAVSSIVSIPFVVLIILLVGALLVLFGGLVTFKKRPLQMKLMGVSVIFISLYAAFTILNIMKVEEMVAAIGEDTKLTYGISYWLPIGAFVFTLLAFRFIKKDEQLVRSVDRIR